MDDKAGRVEATDEPPRAGGLFRRKWVTGRSRRVALSFGIFEELWGPTKHEARVEVEERKRVGKPAPAPSDPPELPGSGAAAAGGPAARFSGVVVVPRP